MKVISLTMNAFMTYKEKTTIHFEEFMDHGLYLISGPTGAGKTTLFDAMTFALYGVASGSHRNQTYFRSDFADAKEETYVEMTFELHQHIYTVKRSPTYTRPGYKTAKMANATLSYKDVIIEGVKEVNQKINQLLGVDVHQFKQIVMIAQGEFTKLIYASSEEREKVLRHIFHSETLVDFENLLKEETRVYKEQYLLSHQNLQSRFQLLSLPEEFMKDYQEGFHPTYIEAAIKQNEILHKSVLESQTQYENLKQSYDESSKNYYAKQKQNQDLQEYQNIQKQYNEFLASKQQRQTLKDDIQKLKIIKQNQSLIDQYNKIQKDIHTHETKINTLSLQQQTLKQKINQIDQQYLEIPNLKIQKETLILDIEKTKQSLQKQKQYQSLKQQFQQLEQTHQQKREAYQQASKQHQKYLKRIERDQENVNQLPTLQLELQQNEQLVKEMNQRRVSIHDLSELYDQYTQGQDKHFELSKIYTEKDQIYQKAVHLYQQEDENFKRQQAGILALTLQDETPCPVCGSLHHPHPASLSKDVLTANELEELNQQVEKAKINKEEAYQDALMQNNTMNELLTKISIIKKQLNIEDELSKEVFIHLLSDITQITKTQEKTFLKRHNEVEYLKKVKKSLEQDYALFQKQGENLEQTQKEIHDLEKQMIAYTTQILELENQHQSLKSTDLHQQLEKQEQQLQDINDKMTRIEQTYHQLHQELTVISKQYDLLLQQKDTFVLEYQQLSHDFQVIIQEHFTSLEDYQKYLFMMKDFNIMEKTYQDDLIQEQTYISTLERMKKLCQNLQYTDLSKQQGELQELEKQRDQALKTYHTLLHAYQQNLDILQQLQKDYTKNQDIFEKYTLYQDLSDVTSGKNTQRMSFERYVLSSYFEHILEYANVELLKMSQGRFALYRKQSVKGVKQQGLDLSVLDYETGMLRDVQSLSGGESFKAALSLALGLSSMIQSYAGGIELNTLFIDEGFGSLDSESIDQALSVLLDLKNDNKVIGIISHVDELKERIPTQIVVEKGKNGSHLAVVCE